MQRLATTGTRYTDRCAMKLKSTICKHNKTGNLYIKLGEVINATNAQEGQQMVIYTRNDETFVRELREFEAKFTPLDREL